MQVFDSDMPEEEHWNSLFDNHAIVKWLDLKEVLGPLVEIGCGYGTFTVQIAKTFLGTIHAFDIDPAMIERTKHSVRLAGHQNVESHVRDVAKKGTGLAEESVGTVLLFNILHSNEKDDLMREASRILLPNGRIAIIHWSKDIETPRGPSVESRPDSMTILDLASRLDLSPIGVEGVLEPYHWGMQHDDNP
jgi:ubiquinone/menaquinone biosynthesis C-methylase UbiE